MGIEMAEIPQCDSKPEPRTLVKKRPMTLEHCLPLPNLNLSLIAKLADSLSDFPLRDLMLLKAQDCPVMRKGRLCILNFPARKVLDSIMLLLRWGEVVLWSSVLGFQLCTYQMVNRANSGITKHSGHPKLNSNGQDPVLYSLIIEWILYILSICEKKAAKKEYITETV